MGVRPRRPARLAGHGTICYAELGQTVAQDARGTYTLPSQLDLPAAAAITLFAGGGAVSAPAPARSAPAVPERLWLDNGLTVIFGEHRAADMACNRRGSSWAS